MSEQVVFENAKVKVTKVHIIPGDTHLPSQPRADRLIINLDDAKHERQHEHRQHMHKSNGTITWRDASTGHEIKNVGMTASNTLVIEIKE